MRKLQKMRKLQWSARTRPKTPPSVEKRRCETSLHGITLRDDYSWLKAANWQEVLRDPAALPGDIRAVIEAENVYAEAMLAPARDLRAALIKEMRGRIKEDDSEVPRPDGEWLYYARHGAGGQHPIFCRVKCSGGKAEILLDSDAQGRGKNFFDIGDARHSPDHAKFAWSADETGSELYAIRVRCIGNDQARAGDEAAEISEVVTDTDGSFVWMADSRGFYYVRTDENHRPSEILRHMTGSDPASDIRVFDEHDPGLFIYIRRSQSARFAIISVDDHDSSESICSILRTPGAVPRLVEPRAPGLHYDVEHLDDRLFMRTNADGPRISRS